MFNTANLGVVAWPVTLTQQVADGSFVDVVVTVWFRVFTRTELRERNQRTIGKMLGRLQELVQRKAAPEEIDAVVKEIDLAARDEEDTLLGRMVRWSGVGDADTNTAIDYTPDIGRAVIAYEAHYQSLWRGLIDASQQARPKNSLPGADGSPAPGQTTTT